MATSAEDDAGADVSGQEDDGDCKLHIMEEQGDGESEENGDDSHDMSLDVCDHENLNAEPIWPGVSRCRKCGFTTDLASLLDVHTCLPKSASRVTKKTLDASCTLPKIPIERVAVTNNLKIVNGGECNNDIADACSNVTTSLLQSPSGSQQCTVAPVSSSSSLNGTASKGDVAGAPVQKCITDDSEIDKTITKDMTIMTTIVKRIDQNTFSCSTCNVNLPFPGFVKHWVCHVKEYPFICYSCSKRFRFEDEIQRHIKASNGKLRYGLIGFKHAKSVLQSLRVGGQITKRGVYVRVPIQSVTATSAPASVMTSPVAVTCISPKTSNSAIPSPFISPVTLLSVSPDGTVTGFQQIEQRMVLGQTNMQMNATQMNRPYPSGIPVFPVSILPQAVVTTPVGTPTYQPVVKAIANTVPQTTPTATPTKLLDSPININHVSHVTPCSVKLSSKPNTLSVPQSPNDVKEQASSVIVQPNKKEHVDLPVFANDTDVADNTSECKKCDLVSSDEVVSSVSAKVVKDTNDITNDNNNVKALRDNNSVMDTATNEIIKDILLKMVREIHSESSTEKAVDSHVVEPVQESSMTVINSDVESTQERVHSVASKPVIEVLGNAIDKEVTEDLNEVTQKTSAEGTNQNDSICQETAVFPSPKNNDKDDVNSTDVQADVSGKGLSNVTPSDSVSRTISSKMKIAKPAAKKTNLGSRLSQIVNTLKSNAVKTSVLESSENTVKSGTLVAELSVPVSNANVGKEQLATNKESVFKVPQKVVGQHDHVHGKVKQTDKIISYVQKPIDIRSYFYVCGFHNCSFASLYSEQFRGHLVMCHSGLQSYPCPHCLHESNGEEELYRHLLTHSSSKQFLLYRCSFEECSYASNVFSEFREHNAVHHSDKHAYTCCNCSVMYSNSEELMQHLDRALLKFVQCVHCNVKSKSRKTILEHMKSDHPGKGRQISVASQLVCYRREFSQSKLAAGYTFIRVTSTAAEKPTPTPTVKVESPKQVQPVPPKKDEVLDYSSKSESAIDESILDGSMQVYKCSLCPYDSTSAKRISNHKRVHLLPTSNKRFLCNYCPIGFDSYDRFLRHVNIYPGVHTITFYNCDLCSYITNRQSHIDHHIEIDHPHTDHEYSTTTETVTSEEYKCDQCSFITRVLGQLTYHKQSHLTSPIEEDDPDEEISPLKLDCRFCPKDFNTLTALERHLANHTEAAGKLNAYRCVTCSAMGTSVTALKNHWRSAHGVGPARIKRIRRNIRFKPTEPLAMGDRNVPKKECLPPVKVPYSTNVFRRDKTIDPDDIRYNGEPRIICFICKNTFKKWASLRVHIAKHPNRQDFNAFQCISCKLRSTSYDYLVQHCIQIHGQSPNTKPRISEIVVHSGDKDISTSPYSRINWSLNPPNNTLVSVPKRDIMKAGQCVICDNDYERICGLMVHVQNAHPEISDVMVYKCFTCRRRSTSKAFMNNHIVESHNGASTFKPIMLKVRRNGVHSHVEPDTEDTPRQCSTCEFSTVSLAEYRFHVFNCNNPNNTEFDFSMPVTSHKSKREEEESESCQNTKSVFSDYQKCRFCSFKTKIRVNMQRHMVWHESSNKMNPLKRLNFRAELDSGQDWAETDGDMDSPPDCPEKTQPEYKLVGNNIIQCTLCDYASFNKTSVRKHFSNKHRRNNEARSFKSERSADWVVSTEVNYGCEEDYYAGKPSGKISAESFKGEDMFRQVYHYRCKLCPKYWSPQYNSMMTHLDNEHSSIDKTNYYSYYMYECNICFKHVKKENRDQHKTEHELSLRCTYCDFATGHRKALTSHMLSHFQYKRYRCQQCWHTTAFRSNIRLHVSRMHPDKKPVFDIKYDESVRRKVMSLVANIHLVTNTPKTPKTELPEDALTSAKGENYIIKCVMCDYTSLTIDVMKLHYEKDHPGHQCKWKRRLQESRNSADEPDASNLSSSKGENDEYILCQPTPNKLASPRRHMNANDVCFPAGPLVSNGQHEDGSFYKQCKICKAKFNAAGSSASYRHIYREHMPACYQCAYCEYRAYPSSTVNVHCRGKHPEVPEAYILVKDEAYKQFEYFYNKISMGQEVDYDVSHDKRKATHELDAFRSNGVMFPARVLCLRTADGNGFQCRLCGAAFNSLSRLPYDHLYANHLPQCFKCPYCSYRAYPRSVVMKHVIKHHPGETKKTILIKDEAFVEFTKLYEKLKETSDESIPPQTSMDDVVDYSHKVEQCATPHSDIADLYIEETQSPGVDDTLLALDEQTRETHEKRRDSQDDEQDLDSGSYLSDELAEGYMSGDSLQWSEMGACEASGLIQSDWDDSQSGSFTPSLDFDIGCDGTKRDADPDSEMQPRKVLRIELPEGRTHYRCNWCNFHGLDLLAFKAHLVTHHEFAHTAWKDVKILTCGFCNISMTNDEEFNGHMRLHMTDHPNCCAYCEYSSFQRSDVEAHLSANHPNNDAITLSADRNSILQLERVVNLQPGLRLVDLADIDTFDPDVFGE